MSTNATENSIVPNETLVYRLPEELTLNPKFDIRGDSVVDESGDLELMESIKLHGQQQAVKIRRMEDGEEVVFGHRRYQAIQRINIEAEPGADPIKVKCILTDMTDEQALQAAWDENAKRKNMSPISEARLIAQFRKEFGWKGAKGTPKVAKFMGKSPAWVSEREKLLALDESMQAKVSNGELSAEAALMLPGVKPESRGQVIAEAQDRQAAEEASKPAKRTKGKGKSGDGGPIPVKARHVAAAIRNNPEVLDDPSKVRALKAKELVAFFESFVDGVPYLYETVQDFLRYFVQKYAAGKGTDRTMEAKFKAMIEPACKGVRCEPQTIAEVGGDAPMPRPASKTKKSPKSNPKPAAGNPVVKSRKKSGK